MMQYDQNVTQDVKDKIHSAILFCPLKQKGTKRWAPWIAFLQTYLCSFGKRTLIWGKRSFCTVASIVAINFVQHQGPLTSNCFHLGLRLTCLKDKPIQRRSTQESLCLASTIGLDYTLWCWDLKLNLAFTPTKNLPCIGTIEGCVILCWFKGWFNDLTPFKTILLVVITLIHSLFFFFSKTSWKHNIDIIATYPPKCFQCSTLENRAYPIINVTKP